jgi:hypothetical protein
MASAVKLEIAIAEAESELDDAPFAKASDPLFRLHMRRWAMRDGDLADFVPVRDPHLRLVEFEFDVKEFWAVRTVAEFPAVTTPCPSYIAAFKSNDDEQRAPLLVDGLTARILKLSDGTRNAVEIARQLRHESDASATDDILQWIEKLFLCGLLGLHEVSKSARAKV